MRLMRLRSTARRDTFLAITSPVLAGRLVFALANSKILRPGKLAGGTVEYVLELDWQLTAWHSGPEFRKSTLQNRRL